MMTANFIVTKRTGLSADEVGYYVALAEARVRTYLHLDDTADLSPYTMAIADIAVIEWQYDTTTKQSTAAMGMKSQSFSEGGVSKSATYRESDATQTSYIRSVNAVLETLDGNAGRVIFL